jgi:hypothetical protein
VRALPDLSTASPLALQLLPHVHAWRQLLREHVDDGSGHCAGCRSQVSPRVWWPCTLRAVAAEVAALAGEEPGGSVRGGA